MVKSGRFILCYILYCGTAFLGFRSDQYGAWKSQPQQSNNLFLKVKNSFITRRKKLKR